MAVANAIHHVGAKPVFAEIDPAKLNLDPHAAERAITPQTRAILIVHTFGVPAEMDAFQSIASKHGLALIEDACEAIGAEFDGRRVGSFGDLAVLGFYPNKQITTGEGGAVLVRDPAHAARLRSLRNQGRREVFVAGAEHSGGSDWLDQHEVGYNYRLSELECALGRVQLARISEILQMRRAAAERYHTLLEGIPGLILPPLTLPRRTVSWFVYVIQVVTMPGRDFAQSDLAAHGIATGRYFAPIHEQPAWRTTGTAAVLPLTEKVSRTLLALPLFNRITYQQQREVATVLGRIMESDSINSARPR
jgi:perosamine synthetase